MNKLVLVCLVAMISCLGISATTTTVNAVTLTGNAGSSQSARPRGERQREPWRSSTYEYDDWKHGDKHDDKWKHKDKGKDGAPVPFESSPALGAMLLVGWGVVSMKRKTKTKKVVV